jgi:hypothetical protein
MAQAAIAAFDLAIRQDEPSQLGFVAAIPSILSAFPRDWIAAKFLPYLAVWFPPNSKAVAGALLPHVDALVRAASLSAAAPLLEVLFSSNDPPFTDSLVTIIVSFTDDPSALPLLSALLKSPWDAVRAAIPALLPLLRDDAQKLAIFSELLVNGSPFRVRYAAARAVPRLSAEPARAVVTALLADPSGRIRGLLPVVSAGHPFFLTAVAPEAAKDHDWAVRASLASALLHAGDALAALAIASGLVSDGVWQVKLCAMRALTQIIRKLEPGVPIPGADAIQKVLSVVRSSYHFQTLKKAIVDLFLAIHTRGAAAGDSDFVEALVGPQSTEERSVQLYFLAEAVALRAASLLATLADSLLELLRRIARSELWRDRLGLVELLPDLLAVSGRADLAALVTGLCLGLTKDEASLVRVAAARQIARLAPQEFANGEVPALVQRLSASQTFRDRQAAVVLIREIAPAASPEQRALLVAALAELAAPAECPNVAALAQDAINAIS